MQNKMNSGPKLKFLVFGATRNTGLQFMLQALDAGHEVTAIIRNPALFVHNHPNLKVVQGDALQLSSFESEVAGKDAIISTLGVTDSKPTVLYSQGVKNMMEAMRKAGVKRIICISASAVETNREMGIFIRVVAKVLQQIFKNSYADLLRMERELSRGGMSWTVIRPPRLLNKPVTGQYRIAVGDHLVRPFDIARADVAHYMLTHIEDETTYGKIVEVGY